jgi:site-specific recombinase XerD
LREKSEDVRNVQILFIIKNLRTKEIYTHVTSQAIHGLNNPFDDLKIEINDEH